MTTHLPHIDESRFVGSLSTWLRKRFADEGIRADRVTIEFSGPVPTGNSNITLPFTARWEGAGAGSLELVLRMQVAANQIFLDPDVLREYRVLAALAEEESVPSPRPLWAEFNTNVLGQPFYVMERVYGTVPTGTPTIHASGWLTERSISERRIAWDSALAAIAAVANVDWHRRTPFLADGPYGTTLRSRLAHAKTWYRWATADRNFPITDAALDYLESALPADPGPPVLLWGDPRMGNLMFGSDHRVAAILDWELSAIGPAGIDLGWWLAFEEFTTRAHGVEPLTGSPSRAETIDHYQSLTGRSIANPRWYEIYCAWTLTVTVIRMADIGVAAGRLPADNRMGEGNLTAQMLARWLDLPVPDLDPNYAKRRGLPVR